MAREKGMGNLQREKGGRWTIRIGVNGTRISRSTGTTDRGQAEQYLQRMLSRLGRGERRVPLSEVWTEYLRSPNRNDLADSTLKSKLQVWNHFARWMERNHLEAGHLAEVSSEAVAEYLVCLRMDVCATTYNNRVCVLREIFRVVGKKDGATEDPWADVRLMADDAHSRRELSLEEVRRLLTAADALGGEWHTLFMIGLYTGMRLGDCCRLQWRDVQTCRGVIQMVPQKTRRHAKGRPVTIPIHGELVGALTGGGNGETEFVLPRMADWYVNARWRISAGLKKIFRAAGITTSVRVPGRRHLAPEATFHSLRHTFVSFAANGGVPLAVVQSIVGHCSTAMTRHYYHENLAELRRAVEAVPAIMRCA